MKLFLLTYDELRKSIISLNVGKNKVYYDTVKMLYHMVMIRGFTLT